LLGIQIHYENDCSISLSQKVFIDSILKPFHTEPAHGAATPLEDKVKLDLFEHTGENKVDQKEYQAIISSLMYIALIT
jgi:hypothetical protein